MYSYIKGVVAEIGTDSVVIEAGGVGYQIIATASLCANCRTGETAKVFVYQAVKEDSIALYGFYTREEKNMFMRMITVSGVGPKSAVQLLSAVSPQDIAVALVTGDARMLTKAPGIGNKTAQRMILELREKVKNEELIQVDSAVEASAVPTDESAEAVTALIALGIQRTEAVKLIQAAGKQASSVEEMIRIALKSMDKGK